MATVILLTAGEADAVRTPLSDPPPLAALRPVALSDGRFYLGAEVLDAVEPEILQHRDFLAALPQVEFATLAALLVQPEH